MNKKTNIHMRIFEKDKQRWQAIADTVTNGNLTQWIELQCENAVTLSTLNNKLDTILAQLDRD